MRRVATNKLAVVCGALRRQYTTPQQAVSIEYSFCRQHIGLLRRRYAEVPVITARVWIYRRWLAAFVRLLAIVQSAVWLQPLQPWASNWLVQKIEETRHFLSLPLPFLSSFSHLSPFLSPLFFFPLTSLIMHHQLPPMLFIARQHTAAGARYWYSNSVRLSVRPSVCPSVRDTLVLYENGLTYRHSFCTIR